MDAVVSSHNLEHCEFRYEVIAAMCSALKPSGVMYLSYPAEESIKFPSRGGTLNYYDDKSHVDSPPLTSKVLDVLREQKMEVLFVSRRYRPFFLFLIGFLLEPLSRIFRRVAPLGSTWALYGFETVIWAKKIN
jgi:hypothetical protein